jgi:hypothetical protein
MRNISFSVLSISLLLTSWGCFTNGEFQAVLFETSSDAVKSVAIYSRVDGEQVLLFQENEDWFASNERVSVPVGKEKIVSVFNKIALIQADSITHNPLEKGIRFPKPPQQTISIEKKDGSKITFQVLASKEDSAVILKFPEAEEVYFLAGPSRKVAKLTEFSLADFRDRSFANFKTEEVIEVRFEYGDSMVARLRQDTTGDWVSGDALLVSKLGMQDFLEELKNAEGQTFDDSFDPVSDAEEGELAKLSIVLKNRIEPPGNCLLLVSRWGGTLYFTFQPKQG